MTYHEGITTEIQKLAPSAVIELFVLDATAIGGSTYRFHAGTNQLRQNIVWQGETYNRFPLVASGFEFSGQGQIPRPKLTVSNVLSAVTLILLSTNDLMGAKVTRKRTLAKFLDAVNFDGGVNPTADDTAEFPEDIYFIDRKSHEDKDTVEFELASSLDLVGVNIPRRQVIQNICIWKYRGAECGFTGAPLYDVNDELLSSSGQSAEAAAVISTNQAVIDAQAALKAAETALSNASKQKDAACEIRKLETRYDFLTDHVFAANFGTVLNNPGELSARFGGSQVALGVTYRQGKLKLSWPHNLYEIERWGTDAAVCSPATTTYNSALAARNAAKAALTAAQVAYAAAVEDLPEDDPLIPIDQCGKRLSSCKLRFGANAPLPFGGFPGAGMSK